MLKQFKLTFFFLIFFFISQIFVYGNSDTPTLNFFKFICNNSYIGISCGPKINFFNHALKSDIAKAAIVDNKLYFVQDFKVPDGSPIEVPTFVYQFNWPNDAFYMIPPNENFLNLLKAEMKKQKISSLKGDKYLDVDIKGTNYTLPIRISYLYEFPSKIARIGFEPTFLLTRTTNLRLYTNSSTESISKEIGTIKLSKTLSYQFQLPISFYCRFLHSETIDLFLCFLAGLEFTSLSLKKSQNYSQIFWELGLNIEYSFKENFKPFWKISFGKSSFPDTRIKEPIFDIVGLIYNNFSFTLELGVRFKILPKKSRCGIPKCNIEYDHVHNSKNFRGKGYFES